MEQPNSNLKWPWSVFKKAIKRTPPLNFKYWYWDAVSLTIKSKEVQLAENSFIGHEWTEAVAGGFLPRELQNLNFGNEAVLLKDNDVLTDDEHEALVVAQRIRREKLGLPKLPPSTR